MGNNHENTWSQRGAAWLEQPLTAKRKHQPAIYKAANAAAMTGAYGWAGFAVATTLGWWGIPVYLAISGASALLYRNHLKNHMQEIESANDVKTTLSQTLTMVLPLSQDIGQTFMRQAGRAPDCAVGFHEKPSYCHIVSVNHKDYRIAISPNDVIEHYNGRCEQMGAAKGTQQFILENASIMAHEDAHISRPWWSAFTNYGILKWGALFAAPIAAALALTGAPVAMPGIATALWAMGSAGAIWLCQGIASRTEEYRADRSAVEKFGTADHLANMYQTRTPSLKNTFKRLLGSHPTIRQRAAAMNQHDAELTPLERASGAVRMATLYSEIAARHAHMFVEKPAAATPQGVLQPVRHATRALV